MKKDLIKNNKIVENILIYFILLQPILDALTTLCIEFVSPSLTVGIIVRMLFLTTTAIGTLFIIKKENAKKLIFYYICLAIYSCIYLYNMYDLNGMNMIMTQIKGLVKVLYFPLILMDLYYIYKDKKIVISDQILNCSLLGYTFIIFISKIIGISYITYKSGWAKGTVGLFYAANEIGAIVCMLAPFLLLRLLKKYNKTELILWILLTYTILEMGTKVPYIGLIFLIIAIIIINILKKILKDKTYNLKCINYSIIYLVILFLITGYFPVGSNMNHKYGNIFPKIDINFENENENENKPIKKPIKDIEEVKKASASGRDEHYAKAKDRYLDSKMVNKLFGIGYIDKDSKNNYKIAKTVEIDYYDILFSQGILGSIIIYTPVIGILIKYIIYALKQIKNIIANDEIILNAYSVFIAFGIALMAGHVLVSPAVSIYLIMVIILMIDKLENLKIKLEGKNNE